MWGGHHPTAGQPCAIVSWAIALDLIDGPLKVDLVKLSPTACSSLSPRHVDQLLGQSFLPGRNGRNRQ